MRKYLAEAIGTFVLVFGGVGSAVLAGSHIGFAGVSLAFGLSLLAMVYTIGPVSGCHVNPAVTLGVYLAKKMPGREAGGYAVAQCVGAVVASAVLLVVAKGIPGGYDPAVSGFGANGFGLHSPAGYSLAACFFAEVVLTLLHHCASAWCVDCRWAVGAAASAGEPHYCCLHGTAGAGKPAGRARGGVAVGVTPERETSA